MFLLFQTPGSINTTKLEQELTAAGFIDIRASLLEGGQMRIWGRDVIGDEIDELDRPVIAAVLAAHNGQPTPEQTERAEIAVELDAIVAKARRVYKGQDSFTPEQLQRLVAVLVMRLREGDR